MKIASIFFLICSTVAAHAGDVDLETFNGLYEGQNCQAQVKCEHNFWSDDECSITAIQGDSKVEVTGRVNYVNPTSVLFSRNNEVAENRFLNHWGRVQKNSDGLYLIQTRLYEVGSGPGHFVVHTAECAYAVKR